VVAPPAGAWIETGMAGLHVLWFIVAEFLKNPDVQIYKYLVDSPWLRAWVVVNLLSYKNEWVILLKWIFIYYKSQNRKRP